MNITNSVIKDDDSNPIIIYLMVGVEVLNMLINLMMAYKINNFQCYTTHTKICCCEFDNLLIETSDDDK